MKLLRNIEIIVATLLIFSLIACLFGYFIIKIWSPYCAKWAKWLSKKLKGKFDLLFFELFYFLLTLLFLYFIIKTAVLGAIKQQVLGSLIVFFYAVSVIFFGSIIAELRNKKETVPSLFEWLKNKSWIKSFVRGVNYSEQHLKPLMICGMAYFLSMLFIVYLKWQSVVYFASFWIAPILAQIWIYYKATNNDLAVRVRRIFIYSFIFVLTGLKLYSQYNEYIQDGHLIFHWSTYIFYVGVVVFFALDRIIKEYREIKK